MYVTSLRNTKKKYVTSVRLKKKCMYLLYGSKEIHAFNVSTEQKKMYVTSLRLKKKDVCNNTTCAWKTKIEHFSWLLFWPVFAIFGGMLVTSWWIWALEALHTFCFLRRTDVTYFFMCSVRCVHLFLWALETLRTSFFLSRTDVTYIFFCSVETLNTCISFEP